MKRLPVEEFRRAIPKELGGVARGEPVTLTKRGKPVAEVVPVGTWESRPRSLSSSAHQHAAPPARCPTCNQPRHVCPGCVPPRYLVTADERGQIASMERIPDGPAFTCDWSETGGPRLHARIDGDRITTEAHHPDGTRRTYVSTDCGATWTEMSKPPTLGELIANLTRAGHALVDAVAAALFAGAIRDPDDVRALLDAVEADSTHDTRDALARGVEAAVVAGRVADATGNTGRALVDYAAAYAAWRGDAS